MSKAGVLASRPSLQLLRRISPSRFTSLGECWLRELWATCWKPALLPTAPTARLGTVIHSLLEAAAKGQLNSEDSRAVQEHWEVSLQRVERSMAASWIESPLQPLRLSVPDFEVRRLRAVQRAGELSEMASRAGARSSGTRETGTELWVSSADGLVGGYIDFVGESSGGLVIRDYKTGVVAEPGDRGRVRTSYELQLKLYAALYRSSYGRWPNRLELVPLSGSPMALSFTHAECLSLLRRATALLGQINERVESLQRAASISDALATLATPEPTTCRFCLHRPACLAYREAREVRAAEPWPNDVLGTLRELRALGNGRLSLAITDPGRHCLAHVRGMDPDPDRHPALMFIAEGCEAAICNVRASSSPESFSELSSTTAYVVQLDEEPTPASTPQAH